MKIKPESAQVTRAQRCRQTTLWQRLGAGICYAWITLAAAQTSTSAPAPSLVLTNIMQIWDLTGEAANQPQRIQTEAVIYFFDPDWKCAFGECQGRTTFLPIADSPMPLKAGQRIAIDGLVLGLHQQILWDKTKVQVLAEEVQFRPLEITNLSTQITDNIGRFASLSGLVEDLTMVDRMHVRFRLLSGNVPVLVTVLTATNDVPLPFKKADFVRLKGMLVPKLSQQGNIIDCALWVARRADVAVTGSLRTDRRFAIPITAVEKIFDGLPENQMIRVAGTVHSHEPGKWTTLWDETGQVSIESEQLQPLQFGDRVEAVGFPYVVGLRACLRNALYRVEEKAAQTNPAAIQISPDAPLRLAAQIQYLGSDEAGRHPAVNLRGVLLWSHPDASFVYVQDASGGIRVVNPSWQTTNLAPGTVVRVRGNVASGDYVPVVTNAVISRVGWLGLDPPQPVSLEQALTGMEDGCWVELNGFVRNVTQAGRLTHLELTSSHGDFQAWLPNSPTLELPPGTFLRIGGVCTVIANGRRQLTGIQIWAPEQLFIKIDQAGTTNPFAADFRPLENLRRFNAQTDLNQRVRTTGTVVLHQPGRYLYLQDGSDSIFALSRQPEHLQPGDRVEVVGFPGHERGKFLLREAVFRRLAGGAEPAPLPLPAVDVVNVELGGLLARAEGSLLNIVQKADNMRLLIRNNGTTFEASLEAVDDVTAKKIHALPIGSRLALTGVYEVQNDEYGRPNSFLLQLRSWDDLQVLAQPSWWTLPRVLTLLVIVLVVFVIFLIWEMLASWKNLRLRQEAVTRIRQLAAFPELNPNPVLEFTAEGKLNYYNQAAQNLSTSLGLTELGALPPPGVREIVSACLATGQPRLRLETTHDARTLSWSFYPIGAVNAVHCYVGEITDRLRLEEQLRQSQKMEAIGQLAGGVAHDFNNILAVIMMQAELAATTEGIPPMIREGLQQILVAAERAASLTRQLLLFGRRQVMQPQNLNLNEAVTSLVNMLQRIIGEDVRLQLNLHPSPLLTRADAGMLGQVLLNLAVNARDAMPEGGRLIIETSERLLDEELAHAMPEAAPGRYVCLSVSDTGAGIPPEVMPHIFEPFFTTKEQGKGTGLGLATVFGIVKQHQGWVKVYSLPGQGANFQVFFPASSAPATMPAGQPVRPKPRGGTETILLAEDELLVWQSTRVFLERNGYRVLEAANGVEALKIWAEHPGAVALLLTDLVMPGGISGQELARRLQADRPQLKVIFTSGYSAEIAGKQLQLHHGENFLQKPFASDQLLETVRRCLDDC